MAVASDNTRQCTIAHRVVHTATDGASTQHPLLGHCQPVTAIGVAVHQTGGGGAT